MAIIHCDDYADARAKIPADALVISVKRFTKKELDTRFAWTDVDPDTNERVDVEAVIQERRGSVVLAIFAKPE